MRESKTEPGPLWQGSEDPPKGFRVLVVGAGVSGCVCAAWLVQRGVAVTIISGALDSVGLPAYGPDVVAGRDRRAVADAIGSLPAPLRGVWVKAAVTPDCEAGFFAVDRRTVSIETKRAMECVPGVEFRQGLVTDLRTEGGEDGERGDSGRGPGRIALGTAFGDVIEGDAVVLAVGLSLGGSVHVGDDVLPGGRYGETPSDGLRMALEKLGACFQETTVRVGPRLAAPCCPGMPKEVGGLDLSESLAVDGRNRAGWFGHTSVVTGRPLLEVLRDKGSAWINKGPGWPAGYPPAPHWTEGLRTEAMVVTDLGEGEVAPLLSPDGVATGEVHLSPPGEDDGAGQEGWCEQSGEVGEERKATIASRLGHTVAGLQITNLNPQGRLLLEAGSPSWVWVAGRAGGAADYLESLCSGVRVADDVAAALTDAATCSAGADDLRPCADVGGDVASEGDECE